LYTKGVKTLPQIIDNFRIKAVTAIPMPTASHKTNFEISLYIAVCTVLVKNCVMKLPSTKIQKF